MNKYCRYCGYCIPCESTLYYCTAKEKVLHSITHAVKCADFVESDLGDVDTGKMYKPREYKTNKSSPQADELDQMSIF